MISETKSVGLTEVAIMAIVSGLSKQLLEGFHRLINENINAPPFVIYNIDDACAFLKIKKKTMYKLVAEKRLAYVKEGRNLRFLRSDLESWILSHRQKTAQELGHEAESQFLSNNRKAK